MLVSIKEENRQDMKPMLKRFVGLRGEKDVEQDYSRARGCLHSL